MYLVLRHQLLRNYSSEKFLNTLEKEVNGIITDLNRTTETSVQIISNESEKLKALQDRVEKRIAEMQQIFTMLDRADGRYTEIVARSRKIQDGSKTVYQHAQTTVQQAKKAKAETPAQETLNFSREDGVGANSAPTTAPEPLDAKAQALGYYRQGRELFEIAELTGLSVGEIELIVELNK